jgi:hypothetical protein
MENEEILKIIAENSARQTQMLEFLSKEKDDGFHYKTPATTLTAPRLHGSSGIFTGPGLERDVITAHIRPMGIGNVLPLIPSTSEDPRFATLTGYTDVVGDEPDEACEDAPAGYVKGCNLTARFGMIRRDTNTIEMDKVMLKVNRGDFTDLVLRGRVLGLSGLEPSGLNEGQILDVITMSEMVNTGVQTERKLMNEMWQGTLGVSTEFPGLDSQIATGQQDADTGTLCASLDSDVKDYNLQSIGASIVNYLSQLEWYLNHNAQRMGLDPVRWVIVMRADLWFELTAVWPCAYNTTKCSPAVDTNSTVFLDGRENTMDRDNMRRGMYIDINGRRYDVIIDDGIFEHNSTNNAGLIPGEFASSIYMVPLTITGGFPVTYREFVDYRQAAPDVSLLRGLERFFWTDGGVYSWAFEDIKWCYKLSLKTEQRVILRTPQLAGRIDNVKYSPLQHLRDFDPDSPYFYDGGVSIRSSIGTPNAVWA